MKRMNMIVVLAAALCLVMGGSAMAQEKGKTTTDKKQPTKGGQYRSLGPSAYDDLIDTEMVQMQLTVSDASETISPLDLPGGIYHIDSFFDVFTELSIEGVNGGEQETKDVPAVLEFVLPDTPTGTFDTEIVSMSLSGQVNGTPYMIRESPTLASTGQTTIEDIGGGLYHIDSFFDVFTELSIDGGQTWAPSTGPIRVELVEPEPGSLALLGLGTAGLLRRRR